MKPQSPVVYDPETRWGLSEITFAKDQPEYLQLPAIRFPDGLVLTRWRLSLKERLLLVLGGSLFLGTLTFNQPLQPIMLATSLDEIVSAPDVELLEDTVDAK